MSSKEIGQAAHECEPRNLEKFSFNGQYMERSTAWRICSSKSVRAAAGCALLALSAIAFYRVREAVAALLLFTVLFSVMMIGVLILWLVEEAAHKAALWLETLMAHIHAKRFVVPARAQAKDNSGGRPWN